MPKIFEVGGCVRDELLGVQTNDIDFTFVLDDINQTVDEGWEQMLNHLKSTGFKIFLETKDCFTVRAKFPKGCLLYTSPSPRDGLLSRMPSSA